MGVPSAHNMTTRAQSTSEKRGKMKKSSILVLDPLNTSVGEVKMVLIHQMADPGCQRVVHIDRRKSSVRVRHAVFTSQDFSSRT